MVDDTGLEMRLSSAQLSERGFDVTTELDNPNADIAAPAIEAVNIAAPTIDADGRIHAQVSVQASDALSGLKTPFIVEFSSPTGKSLQQWAYLDDKGHADVDFVFSEYSASGTYRINTIRVQDLAGNLTHADDFLAAHPRSVVIDNPLSDAAMPELLDFGLTAVFDPVANRPKIIIQGRAADDVSGVSAAYIRLWSPQDSQGENLDKWLSTQATSASRHQAGIADYLALPSDYSAGQYTVGYLMLQDGAGNEITLSQQDLESRGFDGSIRVYFPEFPQAGRQTEVHGSERADYVFGSNTTDDVLAGGAGADYLYAGKGNDQVDGGAGDDLIVGGDGAGDDKYEGGTGIDTVKYTSARAGISVNLGTGLAGSVSTATPDSAGIGRDTLSGIENLIAGNYDDTLVGSSAANVLEGGSGNDSLNGGAGADTLVGGAGNDLYYVDQALDRVTEASSGGTDTVYSSYLGTYTLAANVEHGRVYTSGTASLTGNSLANTLYAGAGNNVLKGEGGTDTVSYAYATAGVAVSLALGSAQASGGSGSDTLSSIENLIGSKYNDALAGNSGVNVLNGGAGADRTAGGDGADTYYVDNALDIVTETNAASTGGSDTVYSYLARYTLGTNVENGRIMATGTASLTGNGLNNLLYAGAGNNVLDGGAGVDTVSYAYATGGVKLSLASTAAQVSGGSGTDTLLGIESITGSSYNDTLTGSSGANVLNGGSGADRMAGGDGSDSYYVDNAGDVVSETNTASTGGSDTVYSYLTGYTLGTNVENGRIMATGTAGLSGNSLDNILYAGAGNNVLNGGTGVDTVSYAYATGGVTASLASTDAQATGGSGTDTLIGIERLIGSNENDTLAGSSGNNMLTGGAGKDTLAGNGGNDIFDFNSVTDSGLSSSTRDIIKDFNAGDRIDLSTIDARAATATNDAFAFIGSAAFSNTDASGQLRYVYDDATGTGMLYGSTDADADAEFTVQLLGTKTLAGGDFYL